MTISRNKLFINFVEATKSLKDFEDEWGSNFEFSSFFSTEPSSHTYLEILSEDWIRTQSKSPRSWSCAEQSGKSLFFIYK